MPSVYKRVCSEPSVTKQEYLKAVKTIIRNKEDASDTLNPAELKIVERNMRIGITPADCAIDIVDKRSNSENAFEHSNMEKSIASAIGNFMFTYPGKNTLKKSDLKIQPKRFVEAKLSDYFDHKKLNLKLEDKKAKVRSMDYLFTPRKNLDAVSTRQHLLLRGYIRTSVKNIKGKKGTPFKAYLYTHPNKRSAVTVLVNGSRVEKMRLHRYDQNLKKREDKLSKKDIKKVKVIRKNSQLATVISMRHSSSETIAPNSEDKVGHMIIDLFGGATNLSLNLGADNFVFTKYGVAFDLTKPTKNGCNRVSISINNYVKYEIKYLLFDKKKHTMALIKRSREMNNREMLGNFVHEIGLPLNS
jgi:hypothetical protein